MGLHNHKFVEDYQGFIGFGLDRPTDEASLIVYLQKFSDDDLARVMAARLSNGEMDELLDLINRLLRKYLSESEYHDLFLKDPDHDHG